MADLTPITQAAFGVLERQCMPRRQPALHQCQGLRQRLRAPGPPPQASQCQVQQDGQRRGETFSLDEFAAVANAWIEVEGL